MHCVSITDMWTVCVHFSSTFSMAKLLSRVDNSLIICREQFNSTTETQESTECQALRKRVSWEEKVQKNFLSSVQNTKWTQTSGSAFADSIELQKNTNFELGLKKIVDCFLDGHGIFSSNLVFSKQNLCKLTIFWIPKSFVKKQLVVQII